MPFHPVLHPNPSPSDPQGPFVTYVGPGRHLCLHMAARTLPRPTFTAPDGPWMFLWTSFLRQADVLLECVLLSKYLMRLDRILQLPLLPNSRVKTKNRCFPYWNSVEKCYSDPVTLLLEASMRVHLWQGTFRWPSLWVLWRVPLSQS